MGEASGFCNVLKLAWEMNCSTQRLYGYWFWSFFHSQYIMSKFGINDVITKDNVLKISKLPS